MEEIEIGEEETRCLPMLESPWPKLRIQTGKKCPLTEDPGDDLEALEDPFHLVRHWRRRTSVL